MPTTLYRLLSLFVTFLAIACSSNTDDIILNEENKETPIAEEPETTHDEPNILFVLADDMGLDATPGYAIGAVKPNMPTIQNLISTGVKFNNVWSNPTCTPTRAGILTGKYPIRTGVIKVNDVLSTDEISIHKYLETQTNAAYNTSLIGKWHLSNNVKHPNNMGIPYYAGSITGGLQSYWNWNLTTNGTTENTTEYATTKITDIAIDWVAAQTKPWFMWLAYNAPHTPFHFPDSSLHSQGALPTDQASIDANPLPYYLASIEAMDHELGRLLGTMSQAEKDNTIIIFLGDNGTPNQVVQEYNRGKGTMYQGGINVPMIIAGKGVTRANEEENALINTTDLFATIAALSGSTITEIYDSKNFKGLLTDTNTTSRDYIFVEDGNDDGSIDYTIRNTTHKYMLFENGSESLFDILNDPLETTDLLSENQLPLNSANTTVKNELVAKLAEIRE